MNIIFLNSFPVGQHYLKMVDPNGFIDKITTVEYWDLTKIYWNQELIKSYFLNSKLNYKIQNLNYFNDERELIDKLKKNKKSIFIYLSGWHDIKDKVVYETLNNQNSRYILCHFDPQFDYYKLSKRLKFYIKRIFSLFEKKKFKKPYAVITSGKLGKKQVNRRFPFAKIINVPSIKVKWDSQHKAKKKNYIVYVDENLLSSPDSRLLNYSPCTDLDAFYADLNNLFDSIEKWFDYKIIVAASGKYFYEKNIFENRKIIYEETLDLINNCKFVLGHMSLALEQALVATKPVILLKHYTFTKKKNIDFPYFAKIFKMNPKEISDINKDILIKYINRDLSFYKKNIINHLRSDISYGKYQDICKKNILEF